MNGSTIATLIIAVLQSGALVYFFRKMAEGLKEKLIILEAAIKSQNNMIKALEKNITLIDEINDKYRDRWIKLEEHFDQCIHDFEKVKARQLKLRDDELEQLMKKQLKFKESDTQVEAIQMLQESFKASETMLVTKKDIPEK